MQNYGKNWVDLSNSYDTCVSTLIYKLREIMKKLNIFVATLMFIAFTSVKAEVQIGLGLIAGQTSISGTETEGTAADTSDRSKSFDEFFVGADIFAEYISAGGISYGVSLVPFDVEVGAGTRTDVNTAADIASEADTGTRTASADISNLITLYTNIPMGSNGWYGLLGYHHTKVTSSENLNESSYGDATIDGYQVGVGMKAGNVKYEISYSDFEDINLSSTGGGTNSISADADAMSFRMSYAF